MIDCRIIEETLESYNRIWSDLVDQNQVSPRPEHLFIHPGWLATWWRVFQPAARLLLLSIRKGERVLGLAPLMIQGDAARFAGDPEIFDYQDFLVRSGEESRFFETILADLGHRQVSWLDLQTLRPDSTVLSHLVDLARASGFRVSLESAGNSLELPLPESWNDYLQLLDAKQRHEVRRKLRRLDEAGEWRFRSVRDSAEVSDSMSTFLELFKISRQDKARFMTETMELYFRELAREMAARGMLRLDFLDRGPGPAAGVITFDFAGRIYLYNNCFDPAQAELSCGILVKVLSIKSAIEHGKTTYDFLKGGETYKHHLGGKEVALSRCSIALTPNSFVEDEGRE
jgi:CelD/BcsL family acetyltransferase involved in cellulose biosynthesis